ncbi:MAG: ribonuclease J [Eubacteriaceae bacterium]|nr:ribonuclease J [Eubacteriaceae bacterium]
MKIIPLGGLEEIGKNFTLVECEDDIIIIDCGIKFPDIDMFGIDYVIPDLSYLEDKGHKIRGLFITHGHEDHIGGIPYFLKKFPNVPIYGTKLTIGLITNKLVEHRIDKKTTMHTVSFGQIANVRGFSVEFIPTNHSIADSAMFYIKNKAGSLFFTGDFKIDLTPVDGQIIDLARIGQIGLEGVDLLVSDSTNATRKGYTQSEKTVGESFDVLFTNVKKRIVVATFATSIHRIQQVFDAAKQHRRKVVISGRSMVNVVGVARELKYLKFKDNILLDIKDLPKTHPEQVVLLTTGTQGEPMSALSRMAYGEHRQLSITEKDLVIISASPIPGNEKSVANIISELMKLGADVVYQGAGQVHVSGHGCQEEMKLIHALVKPKYFMPCHGEYHMLRTHAQLAESMGMSKNNIFLMQNGDVLQLDTESAKISGSVPSGIVFIDGTGIGDVGTIVLKDRKRLSQDGLLIIVATLDDHGLISGPDIVSRGFVYMRESEKLLSDAKNLCERVIKMNYFGYSDYSSIKNTIKFELERFLYDRTRRKPLVLPILMSAKSNLAKQIDRMRG